MHMLYWKSWDGEYVFDPRVFRWFHRWLTTDEAMSLIRSLSRPRLRRLMMAYDTEMRNA